MGFLVRFHVPRNSAAENESLPTTDADGSILHPDYVRLKGPLRSLVWNGSREPRTMTAWLSDFWNCVQFLSRTNFICSTWARNTILWISLFGQCEQNRTCRNYHGLTAQHKHPTIKYLPRFPTAPFKAVSRNLMKSMEFSITDGAA